MVIAASSTAAAAPAATTSVTYRLCDDPARHYLVVGVHRVGCSRAHKVAKEYFRRLYGLSDGSWHHVLGFTCGRAHSGIYFGLYGDRVKCRQGGKRIRADYRGE